MLVGAALILLSAPPVDAAPFVLRESIPSVPGDEPLQGWGSDARGSPSGSAVIHVGSVCNGNGCDATPPR